MKRTARSTGALIAGPDLPVRRDLLASAGALLASLSVGGVSQAAPGVAPAAGAIPLDFPGDGPIPWIKRIFHLYTGDDGFTRAEQLPVIPPTESGVAQLLRRAAERVTMGGTAPHAGFKFHVAHQPTLLIPLFGSMVIELADGARHELVLGDLAVAEDCTGKGHISRAGPQGSFMVSVQLPKTGCRPSGSSDMTRFWQE
jgi:hypothetical protein